MKYTQVKKLDKNIRTNIVFETPSSSVMVKSDSILAIIFDINFLQAIIIGHSSPVP
jgi:hypothetical protein